MGLLPTVGNEERNSYSLLKDLRFEISKQTTPFSLCFWVFLTKNSTTFPCTILHHRQLDSDNPFLGLAEDKRLVLSPSFLLHKEDTGCIISEKEFPLNQWVHLGFEVSSSILRIYVDGKIVRERHSDSLSVKGAESQSCKNVSLSGISKGCKGLDGYVYNAKVLHSTSSVMDHYFEDPPLRLRLDSSSALDIEVDSGGVWSIVGGKASCRKPFSLDVVLENALGDPVDKSLEVVTSLIYANDSAPVKESNDAEAPLLTTFDGLEFPSGDRPSKLVHGRAKINLTISQVSSKCDEKLFIVKFDVLGMENYPFFQAFSPPIRCISRIVDTKKSTITWKKLSSGTHLFKRSTSPKCGSGCSEQQQQNENFEARATPQCKRVKLGGDSAMISINSGTSVERADEECTLDAVAANKVHSAVGTSLGSIQENYGGLDNSASDSESVDGGDLELLNIPRCEVPISDLTIFRYCLGGLSEKSAMLKEIALSVSEQEIADMAEQISFSSGCSHHRYQIMMAKKLLVEGERAWNSISQHKPKVHWDNIVFEIEELFMRVACCSTRSLTQQDLNFLRKVSGGQEYVTREDFDRMWQWLYPVAITISREEINNIWASANPKWIVGFVTKEDVEHAFRNPLGIQEPGTFILRFPTSRSWPHPDAGSLVVSYVGRDFSLRHRQLSLDYSVDKFDTNSKSLQEMLLSEPELSRVGRMMMSDLTV